MFHILSLDGGGVRGILQARLVERLNNEMNVVSKAQAFAGTSVGSIVAAGLAVGMSPSEIASILEDLCPKIFKKNFLGSLGSIWGLRAAKHENELLKKSLEDIFRNRTIGDVDKSLLITTFNLKFQPSGGKPYYRPTVLHNIGRGNKKDMTLADACLCSSAAPTYLPIYSPRNETSGFVDGGIWGNNPSMSIVSQLMRPPHGKRPQELSCLSVGTGYSLQSVDGVGKSWGLYSWVRKGKLLDILTGDASTGSVHYYAETLLQSNYHRLQPHIEPVSLDDASNKSISYLKEEASRYDLGPTLSWLRGFWT